MRSLIYFFNDFVYFGSRERPVDLKIHYLIPFFCVA